MTFPRTRVPALLSLAIFFLLTACADGPRDIRNYYFPARELDPGLMYIFDNTGTLPGPEALHAYYLGVPQDTGLFLAATQYSPELEPQQQTQYEVRNDGVYQRQMFILRPDSSGQSIPIETETLFDKVFPFYLDAASPEATGYRIKFEDPAKEGTFTYVSLDRRFRGDTMINVLGKNCDAIVFDLAGEVSLRDPQDGDISPQFTGFEIYAKGLGLVQHVRTLSVGSTLGGRLKERMPMDTFLAKLEFGDGHEGHNH